uniref:ParA family protein n=1 Tax=Hirondellea gigas TaxID=1518452 RepID=A0A6A7G907_9CRUS
MGKVILFKNNKGGVGKSLLTFWTAHGITSQMMKSENENFKILILTSDSQNNILQFSGIKHKFGKGLEEYIENGTGELIRLRENLMYIPLTSTKIKSSFEDKFLKLLETFKKQYDFIFIDGSPVLELDNVFVNAADSIIVPTYLDTVTNTGVINLINSIDTNKIVAIVPNRVGRGKKEKEYYTDLKNALSEYTTITSSIPQTAMIRDLTEKGKTIWETKVAKIHDIKKTFIEIVGAIINE